MRCRNYIFLFTVLLLNACGHIALKTNVDGTYVITSLANSNLHEFPSTQAATGSGAILIGGVEGIGCAATGQLDDDNTAKLKKNALEHLRQEVINRDANAYVVKQCHNYSNYTYDCDKAVLCTGQAYDYL